MESWEDKNLGNELKRGMELAEQLQAYLKASNKAHQLRQQFLSLQKKALSTLTSTSSAKLQPIAQSGDFEHDSKEQEFKVNGSFKESAAELEFKESESWHSPGESLQSKDSGYEIKELKELKVNEGYSKSLKDESKPTGLADKMFKSLSDYEFEELQDQSVKEGSSKRGMDRWEDKNLGNELNRRMELAEQLQAYLKASKEAHQLRQQFLFLQKKAFSTLTSTSSMAAKPQPINHESGDFDHDSKEQEFKVNDSFKKSAVELEFKEPESWQSIDESLQSKDSGYEIKELKELKVNEGYSKRRQILSLKVLVPSNKVLRKPHPDGYKWRKYRQKEITGEIYPRMYYRCAHRNTQFCCARKQVQRVDKNPVIFSVTYIGRHTCTLVPNVMLPRPTKMLAPLDTVRSIDGNDKQDSKPNQTCISSMELTMLPKQTYAPTSMWKDLYDYQVRKNCKLLNRKKDVLLLFSSYPMIKFDNFDSEKWITDVLAVMRNAKSAEKDFFGAEVTEYWAMIMKLNNLSERLQELQDVPLMNDIEGVLPGDIADDLYRPTEADLRPLVEVEQNVISRKTSKSTGSPSHKEGAGMEAGHELQRMLPRCKTQVEDFELSAKETQYVPEEILDLAVDLAVRQILNCINRGGIRCITISGRDKKRVTEAIKYDQDIGSKFGYIIGFTMAEDLSVAEVQGVFHLQKGYWLGRCSDSVDLTPEYSGILLITEDDYDEDMNLNRSRLPFFIDLDKLVDSTHSDSRFIIFTSKLEADMEIRMEDHLLSWKLFSRIVGEGFLSPSIQKIAACMLKECRGNLLAIILMTRFLKKVIDDAELWELAVQRLTILPPCQIKDVDNALVNTLTFIWERMNNKTRHCIKLCTKYPKGEKIDKLSLIQHWIQDCLVDTYDEGTYIFQCLAEAFLPNLVESSSIQLRREVYDVLVLLLIPQMHPLYLMQGGLRLTKPPAEEEWDAKEIHLMDNKLSVLPESPKCPSLIALYLQKNLDLMAIPSCFFNHMPLLLILDLSHTSIKSLPESLSGLAELRELLLKGCELFIQLPSHVGELKNLEKLDLDETQIIDLPAEIGQLSKLKILRISFYGYMNCSKTRLQRDIIIPPGTISGLSELTELSIDVDPDDERWNATVETVIEEACNLKTLKQLNLYLPSIETLWKRRTGSTSLLHYPLPRFRFTVGYRKQQVVTRVPEEVAAHFNKGEKCLKFAKGKDIPIEMRAALKHSTTFFLEGHATARSLSDFGIKNTGQLKFCLLTECNEVQAIVDSTEFPEELTDALGNLQDLNIYYMKNLESIWRGPVHKHCLASLKFLALHKCPRLSTIFSPNLIANFANLEELIVEHCPQLTSLVSLIGHVSSNSAPQPNCLLPSLKRISLLFVPKLVNISNGSHIATKLEKVGIYNCPKLMSLFPMENSSENLKVIKAERHWWEALEWKNSEWENRPDYLLSIFSPLIKDRDVKAQLVEEGIMHHAST